MQPVARTTLDALLRGATAVVLRVEGDDEVACRLRDMGFWPGTPVSVGCRAPLGDPTVYRLRGFRLALRTAEAARVVVTGRTASR